MSAYNCILATKRQMSLFVVKFSRWLLECISSVVAYSGYFCFVVDFDFLGFDFVDFVAVAVGSDFVS